MSKKNENKIDMVNGPILKGIIMFALPLAISSFLQQVLNAADVIVCGKFVGSKALAAVGVNTNIMNLAINLFLGLSVGVNVVIANYIGMDRKERISPVIHSVIPFSFIIGLIFTTVGIILSDDILIIMQTPEDIFKDAREYLIMLLIGMPGSIVYNFGSAVLRSKGDTKRPLYILFITGFINVILNVILVTVVKLGVLGVAISTVVSIYISAMMIFYLLTKEEEYLRFDIKKIKISREPIFKVFTIGLPSAVQGAVFSISNITIQAAINSLGSVAVAGNSAANNIDSVEYMLLNSFSQAGTTFTSQNIGARRIDRLKKIFRCAMLSATISTFLVACLFYLNLPFVSSLFTDEEAVKEYMRIRFMYVAFPTFLEAGFDTVGGILRGMGHSNFPAFVIVIGTLGVRMLWVFTVFATHQTYQSVLLVYPISWIIMGFIMITYYFIVRKKDFELIESGVVTF